MEHTTPGIAGTVADFHAVGSNQGAQTTTNLGTITNNFNYANTNDLAPWTSGNVHWTVKRPVNNLFTGRRPTLRRIEESLQTHLSVRETIEPCRIVITGMAGLGKSELCLRVANDMKQHFWGVFWIDVETPNSANHGFLVIAKELGKIAESSEDTLRILANLAFPCLLILDNADDPYFDYQEYICTAPHVVTIITSRNEECAQYATAGHESLGNLEDSDAMMLLLKTAKIPVGHYQTYQQRAQTICQLLNSHTLALIQAGAFIAQKYCTFDQYPQVFEMNRLKLLQFHNSQARSRYGNVFTTFEASARVLEKSDQTEATLALEILSLLSMLDRSYLDSSLFEKAWVQADRLTTELAAARPDRQMFDNLDSTLSGYSRHRECSMTQISAPAWDQFRLVGAINLLESLALVSVSVSSLSQGKGFLYMHPLIHSWAKDRQNPRTFTKSWKAAASFIGYLRHDNDIFWDETKINSLKPHLVELLGRPASQVCSHDDPETVTRLLFPCFELINQLDMLTDYEPLCQQMFHELKFDRFEPRAGWLELYYISCKCFTDMTAREKLHLSQKIVRVARETLPLEHMKILKYRLNVIYQRMRMGYVRETITELEIFQKLVRQKLPLDNIITIEANAYLACAYDLVMRYDEAVIILEETLEVLKRRSQPNGHRTTIQTLLAQLYVKTGKAKEAIMTMESLPKSYSIVPEDKNIRYTWPLCILASAYVMDQRIKDAVMLLETFQKAFPSRMDVDNKEMILEYSLALAYGHDGQVKEGLTLMEQVVAAEAKHLHRLNMNLFKSRQGLSILLALDGQYKRALTTLEDLLMAAQVGCQEADPFLTEIEKLIEEVGELLLGSEGIKEQDYAYNKRLTPKSLVRTPQTSSEPRHLTDEGAWKLMKMPSLKRIAVS